MGVNHTMVGYIRFVFVFNCISFLRTFEVPVAFTESASTSVMDTSVTVVLSSRWVEAIGSSVFAPPWLRWDHTPRLRTTKTLPMLQKRI
jgi:hypothetical protein